MSHVKIIHSLFFKLTLSLVLISSCSTVNDSTVPPVNDKSRKVKITQPTVPTRTNPELKPVVNTTPPRETVSTVSNQGYTAQGLAAWYSVSTHGQKTASGEVYDLYDFTAAHATLPLMSFVRVTNLQTGRSVIVKINDRLPAGSGTLILLSYSAVKRLELLGQSTTLVQLHGLPPQPLPSFP